MARLGRLRQSKAADGIGNDRAAYDELD